MKKFLLALLCLLYGYNSFAQKIKAGVAVFGTSPAGIAAAIQSAHSGVETVLIDQGTFDLVNLTPEDKVYKIGIYKQFLQRVDSVQKNSNVKNNESLIPAYAATLFKGWTDTVKNLTVIKKAVVREIKRDGKNWEISFTDRRELKALAIVDATTGSQIARKAGISPKKSATNRTIYSDKIYRTSVAIPGTQASHLPVSELFADSVENFLLFGENVSPTLLTGQAAGAAAAYCAFFDVTNEKLDIRKTQAELIAFNSQFIRFDDISISDSIALSIQKIAVTGVLKGRPIGTKLLFNPDSTVSSEEIRLPLKEYYTRSQIWFLDNKTDKITLKDALSLIKFTANRGKELDKEVEKGWNTSLKLSGKFDMNKVLTRKELARLFDLYLKPFDRAIDLKGNLKS